MYLSRIKLNTSLTKTMKGLASPSLFHGAIESSENCEKEERTRKLWRIDKLRGEDHLLILSESKIDFSSVSKQFGYGEEFESKCYDNFLESISEGSRWRFRLRANPTVQKYAPEKGRGKAIAHITIKHQEEWLKKQSEKYGFILSDEEWLVTESHWYNFKKNRADKSSIKLLAVTFDGILTVADIDKFRSALTEGIGREKAYGMGMLTIAGI